MSLLQLALVVFLCVVSAATGDLPHPFSDEFIELINAKQNLWTAGRNFPIDTPFEYIKKRMGINQTGRWKSLPRYTHDADLIASLPKSFNPRDKWPYCPSLNEIRDQGSCKSGWAFSAVEAMTDRICTYSNGTKHFHFSAEDIISCCIYCGIGCDGGDTYLPWVYWCGNGVVSGGNYNSNQGCKPYEIPPCNHYETSNGKSCSDNYPPTPNCSMTCQPNYNVSYKDDKKYGKYAYPVDSSEDHIKAELFKNGPAAALFTVYEDFISYKSGVYKHTQGAEVGSHSVKIMGWGEENGVKYWLAANSWNSGWGENGFFKILRGVNHCEIETFITAGEPNNK